MKKAFYFLFPIFLMASCSEDLKQTPNEYSKIFTGENNKTWKVVFIEYVLNGEADPFGVDCLDDDSVNFTKYGPLNKVLSVSQLNARNISRVNKFLVLIDLITQYPGF